MSCARPYAPGVEFTALDEIKVFLLTWDLEIFVGLVALGMAVAIGRFCWNHREWFIIREGDE